MRNKRPEVDPEALYNQTEAAALLGVDRHTVRNYELAGSIKFMARKAGGRKVTTGAEILRCWGDLYKCL